MNSQYRAISAVATSVCLGLTALYFRRSGKSVVTLKSLEDFELREILKDEDDGRVVTLLGKFKWQAEGERALVKLAATSLPLKGLLMNLQRLSLTLKSESGAEYAFYNCTISPWIWLLRHLCGPTSYSCDVVAPATERTISRNRRVEMVMVTETAKLYTMVTRPHIESVTSDERSLAWLYKVLSKEKEKERVLYEDEDQEYGFILNIDTKWRSHPDPTLVPREKWLGHPSTTDLYVLAICHQKGVTTLRDLRSHHLPMLRNIYTKGIETIKSVYGISEEHLRVFVHYHPQFYHFHVHFTRLRNEFGVQTERAHLLLDVIQNLESDGMYYASRTIQYRLKVNDKLLVKIRQGREEGGSAMQEPLK